MKVKVANLPIKHLGVPKIFLRACEKTSSHEGLYSGLFTRVLRWLILSESLDDRVKKALEDVRPQLQADGGDIEFVGFDNGIVKVKLKGSCSGCPMSTMTLQWGVENYLKKKIPEVKKVEAVQ